MLLSLDVGQPRAIISRPAAARTLIISCRSPVLFEDGTYDVMRSLHIKKKTDAPPEKQEALRKVLERVSS